MKQSYFLVAKMFLVIQKLPENSTSTGLLSVKIPNARGGSGSQAEQQKQNKKRIVRQTRKGTHQAHQQTV